MKRRRWKRSMRRMRIRRWSKRRRSSESEIGILLTNRRKQTGVSGAEGRKRRRRRRRSRRTWRRKKRRRKRRRKKWRSGRMTLGIKGRLSTGDQCQLVGFSVCLIVYASVSLSDCQSQFEMEVGLALRPSVPLSVGTNVGVFGRLLF